MVKVEAILQQEVVNEKMNFNFNSSTQKHLFEINDGIPVSIYTYENVDYLLYLMDLNDTLEKGEYMLATIDAKGYEQVTKQGVKSFLISKLESNQLFHCFISFMKDSQKDEIRLITKEKAISSLPIEEFTLEV